jgi:hypothetical protein
VQFDDLDHVFNAAVEVVQTGGNQKRGTAKTYRDISNKYLNVLFGSKNAFNKSIMTLRYVKILQKYYSFSTNHLICLHFNLPIIMLNVLGQINLQYNTKLNKIHNT